MTLNLASRLREMLVEGPVLLSCAPCPECVLGAVGLTYLAHADEADVRLCSGGACQPALGEQVMELRDADSLAPLARRVLEGIARSQGGSRRCRRLVLAACASDDPAMPQAMLDYARLCFARGRAASLMDAHPAVLRAEGLARHVVNECEHTRQFVRFSLLEGGSYYARISPNANTLPLVAGYFAARMADERFCLLDPRHRIACLHEPGHRCQVVALDEDGVRRIESLAREDAGEAEVRALWKTFFDGTSQVGRGKLDRGYDLQARWIPRRFWAGLPELSDR